MIQRVGQLPSDSPLWISVVTLREFHYGYHCNPSPDAEGQREVFSFIRERITYTAPISKHTTEYYGRLRAALFNKFSPKRKRTRWIEQLIDPASGKELGIQENDLWIFSQALEFNFTFVSNDKMNNIFEVVYSIEPDFRFESDWAAKE